MNHIRVKLAWLLVLLMVASACSGNDTTEDTDAETTTTAAPADTTSDTSAPSGDEPDEEASEEDAWAEIEDAARAEGQLVLYTATHDGINTAEIEAFQAAYPEITVTHTRLVSGELTNRFASETESGAPSADLIKIADSVMLEDRPEWFIPLSADNVPNIGRLLAEPFDGGHYLHMMVGPFVVTSNTDLVAEPLSTWEGLIAPEYAGNGMLADPRASGSFMAAYAQLRAWYGDEFLEAIRDGGYTFYDSSATAVQQAGAGETGFVGPGQAAHSKELREAGAPLTFTLLEPTIALTHIVAVPENAENPNAALVYVNWLLTDDGQRAACQGEYLAGATEALEECPPAPTDVTFVDPILGQEQADEIVALLGLDS